VLPESVDDFLVLRPLGGSDQERTGIFLPLEGDDVQPATFNLPDPSQPGDFRSCRMLRDAVRLGFRNSAGPFRSFARLNVEPRPYQLVPLLMALKLDPIRLLIADDVGIGKTVEALLVARELLDRGEIRRLVVLCPPHLAEQWQDELRDKFHIDAELVLPSTVNRLERNTSVGQSLFDIYPHVIVSTDYIKSSRRRDEFVRTCPEFVIVDEAHTCAYSADNRGGKHLRHQLIQALSRHQDRHLILVTATPHSGDEGAFRSLLGLLREDFETLPEDLRGAQNEHHRREVAAHLVQRRRVDVRQYMDADTPFPERKEAEAHYRLTADYQKFFDTVLAYTQERVRDQSGDRRTQRVRWWSALALLRSLASSPAAAAATLRARSVTVETEDAEEADTVGERTVLDLEDTDAAETLDVIPGSQEDDEDAQPTRSGRERLLRMARQADALQGPDKDAKLATAITLVKQLLKDGFQPILFCRFIATAEYLAEELRKALPNAVEVAAVTGTLPPAEREQRVRKLGEHPQRVLVATDCLSEGINLQDSFDAVMHYDLSWNPTRHEQREGRADRFGQPREKVRVLTFYGIDNQIDGIVLDVLLRKHKKIKSSLGISVPVPGNTEMVIEAIFEGLLLKEGAGSRQLSFDFLKESRDELHAKWDDATAREKRSRTMFAQEAIKVEEVANNLSEIRNAIGSGVDVARFVQDAFQVQGAVITKKNKHLVLDISEIPRSLKDAMAMGDRNQFKARFEPPVDEGVLYLSRTHPIVESLANYVTNASLDPVVKAVARRCGVIRTKNVSRRTTLLLVRLRYHIITVREDFETPILAEECRILAFRGAPDKAEWLNEEEYESLLFTEPDVNINPDQASDFIAKVNDGLEFLKARLEKVARDGAEKVLQSHRGVRAAARQSGIRYRVEPHLPPDVLGIYVYLPVI
jgi:superfamily II DNA or RNA helicase